MSKTKNRALEALAGPLTSEDLGLAKIQIQVSRRREEPTGLRVANGFVLSLGLVALGDNWRDATACSAVTVLCHDAVRVEVPVAWSFESQGRWQLWWTGLGRDSD